MRAQLQLELFDYSELASKAKPETPLKTLNIEREKLPKRMFKSHIELADNLYQLYQASYAEYEKTISRLKHKRKNPYRVIRNIGIIAETAGEEDFALDLYGKIEGQHYFKYLLWKRLNGTAEELAECLEGKEIDTLIGKFVKLKDFEKANALRKKLRALKREEGDYIEAANISYRMHDLDGLLEDVTHIDRDTDIDEREIVKYARVSRAQSREISDKLFSVLEQRALAHRRFALVGLARAGKGDKEGAVQAYTKARKFCQATNLRINLNIPHGKTASQALEQAFHIERLGIFSENSHPFFNTTQEIERGLDRTPIPALKRAVGIANRYHIQRELEQLLVQRGMYTSLGELSKSKAITLSTDYTTMAREVATVQSLIKALTKGRDDRAIGRDDRDIKEYERTLNDLRDNSRKRGLNEEAIDYLTLFYAYSLYTSTFTDGETPRAFLFQSGLDSINSLFKRKQYSLLIECTPTLALEREKAYYDDCEPDLTLEAIRLFPGEEERQKQATELLRLAGKRQRRIYSELGLNHEEDYESLYALVNRDIVLRRMGIRD